MTNLKMTLPVLMLLALATPSLAQTADTSEADTAATGETPDPLELSMGQEGDAAPGEIKVGDVYVEGEHGDWEIRCIKSEEGTKEPANCISF